jgi:hypothetical protein
LLTIVRLGREKISGAQQFAALRTMRLHCVKRHGLGNIGCSGGCLIALMSSRARL